MLVLGLLQRIAMFVGLRQQNFFEVLVSGQDIDFM